MPLILKNARLLAFGGAVILCVIIFFYVKNLGYSEKEREVLKDNAKNVEQRIKIANNRPDVDTVIDLLRNGKF